MLLLNVVSLWFIASGYMGILSHVGIVILLLLGIILAIKVLYELFKFLSELLFPVFLMGLVVSCISIGVVLSGAPFRPGVSIDFTAFIWYVLGILIMIAGRKQAT